MDNNLGRYILLASVILAIAIIYASRTFHRYELQQSNPPGVKYIFDRTSGVLTTG
jgi:hypothetical protein